jgi:hypothetical protein
MLDTNFTLPDFIPDYILYTNAENIVQHKISYRSACLDRHIKTIVAPLAWTGTLTARLVAWTGICSIFINSHCLLQLLSRQAYHLFLYWLLSTDLIVIKVSNDL